MKLGGRRCLLKPGLAQWMVDGENPFRVQTPIMTHGPATFAAIGGSVGQEISPNLGYPIAAALWISKLH
jgi:hypothetical protein